MLSPPTLKRKRSVSFSSSQSSLKKRKIDPVLSTLDSTFMRDFPLIDSQTEVFRFWEREEEDALLMNELFSYEVQNNLSKITGILDFFIQFNETTKNEVLRRHGLPFYQEREIFGTKDLWKNWEDITLFMKIQKFFQEIGQMTG